MNIDNNIKTCITGLNCQAGYATVSHCISLGYSNVEIRVKCDFIIEMSFLLCYNRTNYRTYTIFHKGVLIWNVLNEEIKNTKTYYSFKKKAKFHYLMM